MSFRVLICESDASRHLGPISFARRELLICVLIRRHTIVVRLVIVLAVTAMPDSHSLQDKLNVIWNEGTQSGIVTVNLCYASVSVQSWNKVTVRC